LSHAVGGSNHDLALSLSKGGRELQACFDKLSTGLEGSEGKTDSCVIPGQRFGSTVSMARSKVGRNMLFMIIERFKNRDSKPIGERFKRKGRMMPEGVVYHASWIDPAGARCFQIMEADSVEPLEQWASRWADLADFEIVPVLTSQDYWAAQETGKNRSG